MKKGVTITVLILIAIVFFGALYYLYARNQESPIVFETDKVEVKTIIKSTLATGNIVPDEEVLIKPNQPSYSPIMLVSNVSFLPAVLKD